MAIFRVKKTKDYTVMSNHHLKNKSLSLKAKGLLSIMLSLSDNWEHSIKGYSKICKDGVDGIRNTIKELEKFGYIIRKRVRNEKGQLLETEYIIYENPQVDIQEKPIQEKPIQEKPIQEKPIQEKSILEKPIQEKPIQEKPILEKPILENPIQF